MRDPKRMFGRWPLLLLVVLALLPRPLAGESRADTLNARLDAVVAQAVAENRIVGGVVVVARDGQVAYRKAFGLADREAGRPARPDTLFRLASMSKPLVSAAALALADQGRLSLDDPVTRWLPYFQARLADGSPATITVRQLLTHTAGLSYGFLEPPDGPLARAGVSDGLDRPGISLAENLRRLATVPLSFPPGTDWGYSLSIDVLGAVVAAAGGGELPEVVARVLTGPLGMADTAFVAASRERLSVPYAAGPGGPHRMADPEVMANKASGVRFSPSRATDAQAYPSGGAGLVGTADDYLRFLEAVRRDGGGVLAPQTARAMTANQIGDLRPALAGHGRGFGFGAAVLVERQAGQPANVGQWAWSGVYGSHFFLDRQAGLSVVVLTNTTPDGMSGRFPAEIATAVYAADATP
ncbi:MAG: serine hydrolase domain-containing protein [Solidesulfovibrio sp. DCME]|uniref:serine hydrolase domain-containing protein n=1 Tax=Solidesulfovibrio sp. DCME TaxID=3447380 RepID=UPI003D0DF89E